MNKFITIFFITIFTFCFGKIFAQADAAKYTAQHNSKAPSSTINKINKINQTWDLLFHYDATSHTGASGNAGVVYLSDYNEIWTSKWASDIIDVWDFSGDSLDVYSISIPGISNIRGMTYDGAYIYAANNTDTIGIIEPFGWALAGQIVAPFQVRYISYDSANSAFWVGNFSNDPTLIDFAGNILNSISYSDLGNTSIYGAAYDALSPNGPFLWIWGQGTGSGAPQIISQISINSGLPTGVQYNINSDPTIGQDSCLAGGLFISDKIIAGNIVLCGVLQGITGPDVLFGYDISGSTLTIPTAVTNTATNITENSATLNGTVNPNNMPTTVTFEYGTSTSYGNIIVADESPVGGGSDVNVTANLTELSSNTLYHYRVVADNGTSTSRGTDATFTTSATTTSPTIITGTATNVTTNSATLNGIVNPNGSLAAVSFQYGITTSYGSQVGATPSPVNGSSNVNVSASITGLQANSTYHFRIQTISNGNTKNSSDASFTTAQGYPATIKLSSSFTFNDVAQSSSYRMIGLPGNQATKISDMISGTQKKDWNAFYDNGATTNFLKEFDGSSTFNFSPGKGFWILSKNQFNANATVQTVTLLTDNTSSISLHSGFNVISNPFENSVSWADVQDLNGLSANDFLFDWSGVWTHSTQMEPYKGYYFINTNNLTSLKIPYNFTIAKVSKPDVIKEENYGNTYIKLSLLENSQEKSYIIAGFNSKAVDDYDKLDNFAPPGNFDQVRIHIDDNNLTTNYKQLFVDYRTAINNGQTFNLEIKNTTNEAVNLIASGLENFANEEVYLFDINVNKFYNLKEKDKISISPLHESHNYRLLIGNEDYINNIKKDAVPISYNLDQNYPNPFNPTTIIRYQIPTDGLVQLKIYNILGKEIKTLVNKEQQQGLYEVELNALDLSSGVYFYCLKAGSFSSTKKMIVIK